MKAQCRTDVIAAICAKNILSTNLLSYSKERIKHAVPKPRSDGYMHQLGSSDGIIRQFAFKEETVETKSPGEKNDLKHGFIKVYCPYGSIIYDGKVLECENSDSTGHATILVPDKNNWTIWCVKKENTDKYELRESSQIDVDGKKRLIEVLSKGNGTRPVRNAIIMIASGTEYGKITGRAYGTNQRSVETCTKFQSIINRIRARRDIEVTKFASLFYEDACPTKILKTIAYWAAVSENVIMFIDEHGEFMSIKEPLDRIDRFSISGNDGSVGLFSTRFDSNRMPGEYVIAPYFISMARSASKRIVLITGACYGAYLKEWMEFHIDDLEKMKFPSVLLHLPVKSKEYTAPARPAGDSVYLESVVKTVKEDVSSYLEVGMGNRDEQIYEIDYVGKKITSKKVTKDWGYPPTEEVYYEANPANPVLDDWFLD